MNKFNQYTQAQPQDVEAITKIELNSTT